MYLCLHNNLHIKLSVYTCILYMYILIYLSEFVFTYTGMDYEHIGTDHRSNCTLPSLCSLRTETCLCFTQANSSLNMVTLSLVIVAINPP